MTGSGNGFDGKYLADENVILVTVNYRLGPLGKRLQLHGIVHVLYMLYDYLRKMSKVS